MKINNETVLDICLSKNNTNIIMFSVVEDDKPKCLPLETFFEYIESENDEDKEFLSYLREEIYRNTHKL